MQLILCRCILLLMAWLWATPVVALNPAIALRDLNHATWTDKEGAPTDVYTMAQTRDEWFWGGTDDGLYRFDGVHFERYATPLVRIKHLYAAENGDLYIAYFAGGFSILRSGNNPVSGWTDLGRRHGWLAQSAHAGSRRPAAAAARF